ncbi:MAG: UDP-glucose/GDP-mannose dehydrogenase family protein [Acidobacteria bacterium]|nr:MAG: UDP-glucose/GDP-mannose dehydrogenase family protein [Acidobacteriota bacterium]REK01867.1 MAG: UDP-glucose/GDP-mannose dehydrogenase family protein [Acidobacteriota bacterium]REK14823.1 MAG: UDP-glucose/GDP-mannose dehydrogenase family protein [Acidobacteriota bacterium]REK45538.1 MAG: UDP-glucose/GDP-mannose dehydrogenase family protein [Acidobacteriota bacterium]
MHIAVIGTGYVGLVTGACFAEFGVEVTCVDVDEKKIENLRNGIIPIYEPGLDKIVEKNVNADRLHFTTDLKSAVEAALVIFLAVGTPPKEDGSPDMSYYRQAALDIAKAMNGYKVLVTKSTVPVGTGKWLREFVSENTETETDFGIASNPEFLREGAAIEDFMRPNRVVIGSNEEHAIAIMKDLYRPLYLIETPVVITSLEAAELIKYASNAFLATKITFINEIANLCDAIGCDVHDVARGMGMDNRIGKKFLHPGPGYGGSCFPKDTRALTTVADQFGVETLIVDAVIEANDRQRLAMIPKIEKLVGDFEGKKIGVLGLSFKPETDDMRESPAIEIVSEMLSKGASVRAFDPVAMEEASHVLSDIEFAENEYDAIDGADAMVIITEWNQFRALDMQKVKALLKAPKVADLRNIYEPDDMREMGFEYIGVGR